MVLLLYPVKSWRRAVGFLLVLCWLCVTDGLQEEEDTTLPPEDGSGPDDEDLAFPFTDVMSANVTFRCYACTGAMESTGCNMTSLLENPADYMRDCNGHCLNISSAVSTVFECTETVAALSDHCMQKAGIKMCVCSSDLCNGPPLPPQPPEDGDDVIELPASQHELELTPERKPNGSIPETSLHRQRNDTYIDAASTSGGGGGIGVWGRGWGVRVWVVVMVGLCGKVLWL